MGVEICLADVTNADEVDEIVKRVEFVFHVEGDTSFWKKLVARQRRINVDGAVNVAEACLRHGVKRMVHTSSVDTLGYNPDGIADESWELFNFADIGYPYAETKWEGEKLVLAYNQRGLERYRLTLLVAAPLAMSPRWQRFQLLRPGNSQ